MNLVGISACERFPSQPDPEAQAVAAPLAAESSRAALERAQGVAKTRMPWLYVAV